MLVMKMAVCGGYRELSGASWRSWWLGDIWVVSEEGVVGYEKRRVVEKEAREQSGHTRQDRGLIRKGYSMSEMEAFLADLT